VASLLKRDAGVKDAGTALPGFGGVLDVIDSPLAVGLVAYWWMRLSEHGLMSG
jgi:phosphatidate cytidylyltransferase